MWKSAGRAPSLRVLPQHFVLQLRKKHGKTSVMVKKKHQVKKISILTTAPLLHNCSMHKTTAVVSLVIQYTGGQATSDYPIFNSFILVKQSGIIPCPPPLTRKQPASVN